MYTTGVSREFRARHFLKGDYGAESSPHAHPYRVELICSVPELGPQGFSVNIALLEELLEEELERIDNQLLNDMSFFADRQTSIENLALYLWGRIKEGIVGGLEEGEHLPESLEIRIWESATAWAAYRSRLVDSKK